MINQPDLERLEGTVSSLIFQNEENGYCILRLEQAEEETTVVGTMPGVMPGEYLTVQGKWISHPTYGRQFKASMVERRLPQGLKEIFHYLSSGAIKGIGKATARRLIEEFGEDALHVLEEEPEKLTVIKGITRKRALEVGTQFRSQMGMRRLLEFLGKYNLPLTLGPQLYQCYGNLALECVRNNPYLLVEEEFGAQFQQADQMALDMGMEAEDDQRLEAGLFFELSHNLTNGHTFLPWKKLIDATAQLLNSTSDLIESVLERLCTEGSLIVEEVAGCTGVYLPAIYDA